MQSFYSDGFVRLSEAIARDVVQSMYQRLWALLEKKEVRQKDPSTWLPGHCVGLQEIRLDDPKPSDSPAVHAALDEVFSDGGWQQKSNWGQVLVTFPTAGSWVVPNTVWHLDHPYHQPGPISGINMFLFIDDVEPGGGGTAVIKSSPLLVARFVESVPDIRAHKHSVLNKRLMQSHPWLQALSNKADNTLERNQRFMEDESNLDGINARVVELTGKAGDVMMCHPWLIHAPAPNISSRPRLMRAQRIYHTSAVDS